MTDAFENTDAVQAAVKQMKLNALPDGEYAIAEILGHRTLIGRVTEVERFGSKLMSIEPILAGKLLPPVLISGGSIYQFTPCSKERAVERAPDEEYYLPASIRAALPASALPAPAVEDLEAEVAAFVDSCTCIGPVTNHTCPVHGDEMPF